MCFMLKIRTHRDTCGEAVYKNNPSTDVRGCLCHHVLCKFTRFM